MRETCPSICGYFQHYNQTAWENRALSLSQKKNPNTTTTKQKQKRKAKHQQRSFLSLFSLSISLFFFLCIYCYDNNQCCGKLQKVCKTILSEEEEMFECGKTISSFTTQPTEVTILGYSQKVQQLI